MSQQPRPHENTLANIADEATPWVGVFIETLGSVLCCLGVIAIDRSRNDTYVLVAVGAPLIAIGVLILWWSAR